MAAIERKSKIANVPPTFPQRIFKDCWAWLEAKRIDDNVEDGLWRIHDTLYDLNEFIHLHPGGVDWIEFTRGHDITELVETHHMFPERLQPYLEKFRVRQTLRPRNSKLTFKEDGFYKTLKRKITPKLVEYQKQNVAWLSKFYLDALVVASLILALLALRFESYSFAILSGIIYTWAGTAAHNFFHQRDNYRMYYFNLLFMSYRDWRITHAISHHMFPNSLLDYELIQWEPIFKWLPGEKDSIGKYIPWLYAPIIYVGVYHIEVFRKVVSRNVQLDDCLPLIMPVVMYLLGGNASILMTLKWYFIIATVSSFWFGFLGMNAGHHHPENVHDGDAVRDCYDFGLYTMDTVIDRRELNGRTILALTHFGDHVLHHLFPTVDHAILPYLYDDLYETLFEFESEARAYPFWELISGQFKQLIRTNTNKECSKTRFRAKYGKRD